MPRARTHAVLVTGATSSLGRQMIQQLYYDKGVRFIVGTAAEERPYYFEELSPDRFAYTRVDLRKPRERSNLFFGNLMQDNQVDTIVHLAFQARATDKPDAKAHAFNIDGTRALLDLAEESEYVKKFIFRSSHQVYRLSSQNSVLLNEESDLNFESGANPWIRDRVDADMLCRARMHSNALQIVVLRLSNLMGMNVKSQLYWFLHGAVAHTPSGFDPMINLLHTKDAVRATQLAIHRDAIGVFNVVGRDTAPLSVISALNGTRRIPLPGPLLATMNRWQRTIGATNYNFEVHGMRLQFGSLMDGRKARKELGYEPINHVDLG